MEALVEKIEDTLKATFPTMRVILEYRPYSEKVGGFAIWDGFAGVSQLNRQHLLRDVLKRELTPDEFGDVTLIVTVTTEEHDAVNEPAVA